MFHPNGIGVADNNIVANACRRSSIWMNGRLNACKGKEEQVSQDMSSPNINKEGSVALKPGRQTREERSTATREKLLTGTYSLLLKVGHAGLRSANISEVSGVSRGGQLHHFATKELLIAAVYEWTVQRLEDESWARIAASEGQDLLEAVVADARARFFSDAFMVILDILVASSEEEPLADTLKSLAEGERPPAREGWALRLAAQGIEPHLANQIVSFLWNTVKGLAIRALVNDDVEHVERVIALASRLARKRCFAA